MPPSARRRRASVVVRVARKALAWALPRLSAIASAKFAKSTVSHSQTAIVPTNQSPLVSPWTSCFTKMPVVMTLPISTMNITGLRTCRRGSSFGKEAQMDDTTMSREKMDAELRATPSAPCRVRG